MPRVYAFLIAFPEQAFAHAHPALLALATTAFGEGKKGKEKNCAPDNYIPGEESVCSALSWRCPARFVNIRLTNYVYPSIRRKVRCAQSVHPPSKF
jgi:hypothetical protein